MMSFAESHSDVSRSGINIEHVETEHFIAFPQLKKKRQFTFRREFIDMGSTLVDD